ncbi:MAG: redoxin family protein, partial [Lachnospiraceae bacterium]|nr:redoxin family protein [Lachnospiraceae bacterium]
VGDHECIHCGQCIAACRQQALSFKAGGLTLIHPAEGAAVRASSMSSDTGAGAAADNNTVSEVRTYSGAGSRAGRKTSGALWTVCCILAIIVLLFAIVWTNFLDPTVRAQSRSVEEDYYDGDGWDPESLGLEEYEDEDGNTYYLDEDGTMYFTDDDGKLYFVDENGDLVEVENNSGTDGLSDEDSGQEGVGEDSPDQSTYVSDAPVGYEVGNKLQDFDASCLDGSTFNTADHRGQVVFINLWATYCGPCVQELPHFVELSHTHGDDVAVLAVHAAMTTEDVNAYLEGKGWDIPFTIDDEDERIFKIVNGSLALPQTIVLNRKGEVVYNRVGSVTAEMLEQLYEDASKE